MKNLLVLFFVFMCFISCTTTQKEQVKNDLTKSEKAREQATHISQTKQELLKRIDELKNGIENVRGLKFIQPVNVNIIQRDEKTEKSIQGYYSPATKQLCVYDDVKGNYEEGVLIHELMHALQDQHFDLSELHLHSSEYNEDAEIAISALIEGDATYTMIECLKQKNPNVEKMLQIDFNKFSGKFRTQKEAEKILLRPFLYSQGAKFIKYIKETEGWDGVDALYTNQPRSTYDILFFANPDLQNNYDLVSGAINENLLLDGYNVKESTFGTYKILVTLLTSKADDPISLLKDIELEKMFKITGRENATLGYIRCKTESSAEKLFNAFSSVDKNFKNVVEKIGNNSAYVLFSDTEFLLNLKIGNEIFLLNSKDSSILKKIFESINGYYDLITNYRVNIFNCSKGEFISERDFQEEIRDASFICVGEEHTNPLHHYAQLHVIKLASELYGSTGVGMEMFERQFQYVLDDYIDGLLSEEEFLKKSEYKKRWGFDYNSNYKSIVDFCKDRRIYIAGLNITRELISKVSRSGYENLSAKEKEILGEIDFNVKEHREYWKGKFGEIHGQPMPSEQEEKMYQSMTTWDHYMARSAARFLKLRKLDRVVIIAGKGHVDYGFGIPKRAEKIAKRSKSIVIHTIEYTPKYEEYCEKFAETGIADFIFVVRKIRGIRY